MFLRMVDEYGTNFFLCLQVFESNTTSDWLNLTVEAV